LNGLAVTAKVTPDRKILEDIAGVALRSLMH
jgi:hypothetical protein